jgi:hypothetical protein
MDLSLVLAIALAALAGAVVALRFIAPKTQTKVDDALLVRLEALEKLLRVVVPAPKDPPAEPKTDAGGGPAQ